LGDEEAAAHALRPYPPNAVSGDVPGLGGYGLGLDVWVDGLPPGVPSQAARLDVVLRWRRRLVEAHAASVGLLEASRVSVRSAGVAEGGEHAPYE
jgi:hypothetical protein